MIENFELIQYKTEGYRKIPNQNAANSRYLADFVVKILDSFVQSILISMARAISE